MPISAQLKASQCASLLALVMLFPFSVGLLWAGAAGNQGSIQRLVGELTAARRWEGPPARGDHEVYFERIELHPRRREDLGASPLGGEPLICWHHERKVRNRRGGGSSWRDVQRGGVACVGTSSTRESLALDLSTARFPLGLPILNEEGAERVRGLRSAAQVTVLASKVDLRGGVLHVGEARVFPTATWSEALAQAQDWERRTASFQGSLTTWGRLLLVLGLGGLFASTLWRHGLRRRLSPASQGG